MCCVCWCQHTVRAVEFLIAMKHFVCRKQVSLYIQWAKSRWCVWCVSVGDHQLVWYYVKNIWQCGTAAYVLKCSGICEYAVIFAMFRNMRIWCILFAMLNMFVEMLMSVWMFYLQCSGVCEHADATPHPEVEHAERWRQRFIPPAGGEFPFSSLHVLGNSLLPDFAIQTKCQSHCSLKQPYYLLQWRW